jgi:hypothetical protein
MDHTQRQITYIARAELLHRFVELSIGVNALLKLIKEQKPIMTTQTQEILNALVKCLVLLDKDQYRQDAELTKEHQNDEL